MSLLTPFPFTDAAPTPAALDHTPDPAIWPVGLDADPIVGPLADVVGTGLRVPVSGGRTVRYANFDVAASAPCLRSVRRVVDDTLEWCSSVHRGAGAPSQVCTRALADARDIVAGFVGARPDDSVVFTRHTTDALNLLAAALPDGTTVVTFASEHHANLLAWRRHDPVVLPIPASADRAVADLDAALESLRTVSPHGELLVAVTGASNVTGEVWPIEALAEVAHRHGGRIVVDAAQLAPHRAIDIAASGIDHVVLSGHKLYAPLGAGALIGRTDWLDAAEPYLAGGGASREVTAGDVRWHDGPARHEAGTPNVVGAVALAAACLALRRLGYDELERHEERLSRRLRRGLGAIAGVERYETWAGADRIGTAVFNVDGWTHAQVATALSAEFGIGVRNGAFCAHRLVAQLVGSGRDTDSALPGAVRASLGASTSIADVDRLIAAVASLAGRSPLDGAAASDAGSAELDLPDLPDLFAALR